MRKECLVALHATAHHHASLLAPHLAFATPRLTELAQLQLKRVVDLGPFKHTVDDGLPVRKAALAALATLVAQRVAGVDCAVIVPAVAAACADKVADVQLAGHQILGGLCGHAPAAVLGASDSLLDPLDKAVNKKIKEGTAGEDRASRGGADLSASNGDDEPRRRGGDDTPRRRRADAAPSQVRPRPVRAPRGHRRRKTPRRLRQGVGHPREGARQGQAPRGAREDRRDGERAVRRRGPSKQMSMSAFTTPFGASPDLRERPHTCAQGLSTHNTHERAPAPLSVLGRGPKHKTLMSAPPPL